MRRLQTEHIIGIFFAVVLAVTLTVETISNAEAVPVFAMPVSHRTVIIDAGHGGDDPGKVSGNTLEKNINLSIALKLQKYLEQGGAYVIMTRVDDDALSNRKKSDMFGRKTIANSSEADIMVSIHQNSFQSASVHGAQVFYFSKSDNSKKLADNIQESIKGFVDYRNNKQTSANSSYYILRQTTMPAVIVECGFLTNYSEKVKLLNDDYQDRIAWAIYMGIVKYFIS